MPKEERAQKMRKAIEFANTDGNLDRAIDKVIAKLESGELSVSDLPLMPIKLTPNEPLEEV